MNFLKIKDKMSQLKNCIKIKNFLKMKNETSQLKNWKTRITYLKK